MMFQRKKRNWDLSDFTGQPAKDVHSHGISWEEEQLKKIHEMTSNMDDEIESGWEEADEPKGGNRYDHTPISLSELTASEQKNIKNDDRSQSSFSYHGLQKKPNFYNQHKKLTIYCEKELVVTMAKLKKERYIPSYSWLVEKAIRFYLNEMGKHS